MTAPATPSTTTTTTTTTTDVDEALRQYSQALYNYTLRRWAESRRIPAETRIDAVASVHPP
jgi:hypothetical protein